MDKIQKVIARAGYCSRRAAEELIKESKVTINGEIATIGMHAKEHDQIIIEGNKLKKNPSFVYYLLNKPRGVISSASDDKGRTCVIDLVPEKPRVFPVGRLDYNTTGALLLTNDGELTNKLIHPKFKIEKRYLVIIEGKLERNQVEALKAGVTLSTGHKTKPCRVKIFDYDSVKNKSKIKITISEGQKHQVKLMFESVNSFVKKLHRETFSIFTVQGIAPGTFIKIDESDIKQLKK